MSETDNNNNSDQSEGVSFIRRRLLKRGATTAAGILIVPSFVVSGLGHTAPSDRLNIAGVGVGGRGFSVLQAMADDASIVALCDVDWRYAQRCFDRFPNASKFWDWRVMYEEMLNDIDAVVVATSDHSHAAVAAYAMSLGKHVYVEKPLTHTVYESRLLTRLAAHYRVATQMGNQGASAEGVNLMVEWVRNGEIGEVNHVEAFTDRPIWPQGINTPKVAMPIPDTMNWDLFIGPARMRPYHDIYTPWNFRGFWDFGTGALGDMACHIVHPAFKALELGYPTQVQGSSTLLLQDSAPAAQKVSLSYPQRESSFGRLPAVKLDWYDVAA